MLQQTCEQRPSNRKLQNVGKDWKNQAVSRARAHVSLPISCSLKPQSSAGTQDQKCFGARTSRAMHRDQVRNLTLALEYAIAQGIAPNRFQTINLQQGGRKGAAAQAALQLLLKTVRDWISSRGEKFAAIWVREIGPIVGEHVHILLHIPRRLQPDFNRKMRHWRRLVGPARGAGLIKTTRLWQIHIDGDDQPIGEQNIYAVLRYMLKGHDRTSQRANPDLRQQDCGSIQGKRCGYTQNLGRAVRMRNGQSA